MIKVDIYNLKLHSEDAVNDKHPFVHVPLLKQFKGESGTGHFVLPVIWEIKSSIKMMHVFLIF